MSERKATYIDCAYDYLEFDGLDAVDLLGRLSTGDLRPLHQPLAVGWTAFTSNQGKMLDWCTALKVEKQVILRCSKGRGPKLKQWIEQYIIMEDVRIQDVTTAWKSFALLNAQSGESFGVSNWPEQGECLEVQGHLYVRGLSAWTNRVDVMVPEAQVPSWLEQLEGMDIAQAEGNILEHARILAGVPSDDFEFSKEVNPLELRLAESSICFDKGCYIGQEVIARMDSYEKTPRILMGFECTSELSLDASMRLREEGKAVGKVTSLLNHEGAALGLAVVHKDVAIEKEVELTWEGGSAAVKLVHRPFWRQSS